MRCLTIAVFAGGAILFYSGGARADEEKGRLKQDITVGANHDVRLKAHQVVQVLKNSGNTAVIMVQLPDGSNGVYQIDAAAIEMIAPSAAPPPPVPPIAVTPMPATANAGPVNPVASTPIAPNKPSPSPPAAATAPSGPPTYPDDFVGNPEFNTTVGTESGGTASVVKLKDGTQSYIVSARHLLGPDGGFKTQAAAKDVPSFVQSIQIDSFSGGDQHYDVTGLLVPATRLKAAGGAPIDDMAIYQNHDSTAQSQAVVLTDQMAPVGARVWVVAHVRGGVPEGQIMQPGTVKWNAKWLIIQFDDDGIMPAGASGAPALNAAGEVVGVYSNHINKDGHVLGFIIPSPLIVKIIKQAPPPAQ